MYEGKPKKVPGRFVRGPERVVFRLRQRARDKPRGVPDGEGIDFAVSYGGMGMPNLLRKIFLLDLLQGLRVTFRYQDPRENYTEQYPLERPQVAERYRGAPRLNVNPDTDETMCIACDLCALACPENLIVVSSERNEKPVRKNSSIYLQFEPVYVLRSLRRCVSDRRSRANPGFRVGELLSRRHDLGSGGAEKGPRPTVYKKRRVPFLRTRSYATQARRPTR